MPVDFFFLENLLTLNDLGLDLFLKMERIGGKIQTVPENGLFLIGAQTVWWDWQPAMCLPGKRSPTEPHPQTP